MVMPTSVMETRSAGTSLGNKRKQKCFGDGIVSFWIKLHLFFHAAKTICSACQNIDANVAYMLGMHQICDCK